jgi:hypothetical protein
MDSQAPRLSCKNASSLTTIVGTPPGASSLLQPKKAPLSLKEAGLFMPALVGAKLAREKR